MKGGKSRGFGALFPTPHPSWNAGCTGWKERPGPFLLHLVPGCLRSLLQGPELPARKVRRPSAVPDPSAPGAAEPQPQREEETGVPQLAATDVSVRSLPSQMLSSSQLCHPSPHTSLLPASLLPSSLPVSLSQLVSLFLFLLFVPTLFSVSFSLHFSAPVSMPSLCMCSFPFVSFLPSLPVSCTLCLSDSLSASACVSVFSPHFLSLSHLCFSPPSLSLFLPKPVKNAQGLVPGKGLGGWGVGRAATGRSPGTEGPSQLRGRGVCGGEVSV